MTKDYMNYPGLVQDALRGVVRQILTRAATTGLPGEHHLYIAFKTGWPGVSIPDYLADRFPDEMTIVLQFQYSGLQVREDDFEVVLSFNKVPERLVVPFAALTGFFDPSVQFGLQFQPVSGSGPALVPVPAQGGAVAPTPLPPTTLPRPEPGPGEASRPGAEGEGEKRGEVVTLDQFRKK